MHRLHEEEASGSVPSTGRWGSVPKARSSEPQVSYCLCPWEPGAAEATGENTAPPGTVSAPHGLAACRVCLVAATWRKANVKAPAGGAPRTDRPPAPPAPDGATQQPAAPASRTGSWLVTQPGFAFPYGQ